MLKAFRTQPCKFDKTSAMCEGKPVPNTHTHMCARALRHCKFAKNKFSCGQKSRHVRSYDYVKTIKTHKKNKIKLSYRVFNFDFYFSSF